MINSPISRRIPEPDEEHGAARMGDETLISPQPDKKPEIESNLRFKMGVCLLLLNIPFGQACIVLAGLLAVKTGHKAFWVGVAVAAYALSWVMLGIGLLLSGKKGMEYAKELTRKWFGRRK
jgi:hypothetical protein